MKHPHLLLTGAMLAALGGSVLAQTAPSQSVAQQGTPVVSDVGPPPAEDRSSPGAVVLDNALVRAQRENAFERAGSGTGVVSIGRGALRATMQARTTADLAQARLDQAVELQDRGAASLDQK